MYIFRETIIMSHHLSRVSRQWTYLYLIVPPPPVHHRRCIRRLKESQEELTAKEIQLKAVTAQLAEMQLKVCTDI